MRVAVVIVVLLALLVTPAVAQEAGTITGVILSSNSRAVPEATVTLYDESGNFADVPENPQLSSGGVGSNAGIYTFYDVPYGIYNVTAEKAGISFFAIADLSTGGTATANVVLPDYFESAPIAPPATPRPYTYFLPLQMGSAPSKEKPGEGLAIMLAIAGGVCALALFVSRR